MFLKVAFRESFLKVGSNKLIMSFSRDGIWLRELRGWLETYLGCLVLDGKNRCLLYEVWKKIIRHMIPWRLTIDKIIVERVLIVMQHVL